MAEATIARRQEVNYRFLALRWRDTNSKPEDSHPKKIRLRPKPPDFTPSEIYRRKILDRIFSPGALRRLTHERKPIT